MQLPVITDVAHIGLERQRKGEERSVVDLLDIKKKIENNMVRGNNMSKLCQSSSCYIVVGVLVRTELSGLLHPSSGLRLGVPPPRPPRAEVGHSPPQGSRSAGRRRRQTKSDSPKPGRLYLRWMLQVSPETLGFLCDDPWFILASNK